MIVEETPARKRVSMVGYVVNRVRKQVGCTDDMQENIMTEEITVAVLDTGERVIIWLS